MKMIMPAARRSIFLGLVVALVARAAAQQPAELIVRNGLIVTAVGRTEGDVRLRNGTIAEIGRNLTGGADAREIDAKGMLVLPGGIDPHVHLTPTPTATTLKGADDYSSGSRAALAGGVTTISNFISPASTEDLPTALAHATELVKNQAIADVILHVMVNDPSKWSPADVTLDRKSTRLNSSHTVISYAVFCLKKKNKKNKHK